MVNLLSLLMFALFSENKHGQVQVSPPLGHKLAFLFLAKFGDRKNLLAIFLFCFVFCFFCAQVMRFGSGCLREILGLGYVTKMH